MAPAMAATSNWSVSKGSLDSCLTLVFLDPVNHEPLDIPPSSPSASTTEKLILVPPPDPVPCEITVKFQKTLCQVQSLYILSTARICELYSRTRMELDSEYICTVKGWVPEDLGESFQSSETESRVCIHDTNKSWYSHESTGHDNSVNVEGDLERLGSSSGEDSWVDLKFNGSLSNESRFGAEMSSTYNGIDNHELCTAEHEPDVCSINPVDLKAKSGKDSSCIDQKVSLSSKQKMYEAELDILDHSPWEAITIRFLSLQDRSKVEVDQVVILAVTGPEIPEPVTYLNQSAERGSNSEILAMFLPSMLQMARGVSRDRISGDSLKSGTNIRLPGQVVNVLEKSVDLSHKGEVEEKLGPQIENCGQVVGARNPESGQSRVEDTQLMGAYEPSESSINVDAAQRHDQGLDSTDPVVDFSSRTIFLTLETFSKRFDRLESLCLRMESYLQSAVERMDQRIALLEERQGNTLKSTYLCDLSRTGKGHEELSTDTSLDTHYENVGCGSQGRVCSEQGCSDMGSVPLAGHASPSALAERHEGSPTNTSITDEYPEQTLLPREAAEPNPSTVRFDMFLKSGCKNNNAFEFAECIDKGRSSNFTSTCDDSPKKISSSTGSEPSRKLHGSLDDAWMSALAAFTSCYISDNENSNNLRCSSYGPFDDTDDTLSCKIKHGEIETEDYATVNCTVKFEPEEYDIPLQVKSDYDLSCQCFSNLELKQSIESEVDTNNEVECKQSLDSNMLTGSGAGGFLNDMINGLSETKDMGQTRAEDKLERRAVNLVIRSSGEDIPLQFNNKSQVFCSAGSSTVKDTDSQIVNSSKSSYQDTQTTDDYSVDCGTMSSGVKDASDLPRVFDDGNKIKSSAELSSSDKGVNQTSLHNDNDVLINQKSCSLLVEDESERPPYIVHIPLTRSISSISSSETGFATKESTNIPNFLRENSLSDTRVDEDIFEDFIGKHTRETHQYEKSFNNIQSCVDLDVDGGSLGNVNAQIKLHHLINVEMLECDAIPEASCESTSNKVMIDIDNDSIFNLLLHTALQSEAESDEPYLIVQDQISFGKDSGDDDCFSVETTFEAERALIDLERSNMNETCSVLNDLLESGPNNPSLEVFSERSVAEGHQSVSQSVKELNQRYTGVFPGFEHLTM